MIKFIGSTKLTTYISQPFRDFIEWIEGLNEVELDIETNVVDQLPERELKTIQFGFNDIQWVLQWSSLNEFQKYKIKLILHNNILKKYIHNASFEYTVLLYTEGIKLENIVDTMLQEKILYTGINQERGFYSLKSLVQRYLNIDLSKEEQTSFDVEHYTDSQIEYAATDVMHLRTISNIQIQELSQVNSVGKNLLEVVKLENQVVTAFGDIHVNGMLLDTNAWRAAFKLAKDKEPALLDKLNSYISNDFKTQSIRAGFYKDKDELNINWRSPKQKKLIFSKLYPDLEGVTKPILEKYIKETEDALLFDFLYADDPTWLESWLLDDYRDFLIENEFLIPAGTVTINWNSTQQRLIVFKWLNSKIRNTKPESLDSIDHPLVIAFQDYIDTDKLVTTYGEEFINKYVDSEGLVRTSFNQILNTGRVSTQRPNMQNIPAKESIGNLYRNCFVAPKDCVYVSSDYNSQELVLIAYLSQDPVWIEALQNGEDLHSLCASLVFGQDWKQAAEPTCKFELHKEKCSCKKHKTMRTAIKTVNFGLA